MMISRAVLYSLLGRRHPWAIKSGQVTTLATPLTHLRTSVIIIAVIVVVVITIQMMIQVKPKQGCNQAKYS